MFKACKSVLFTKRLPDFKIKNTWLTKLTHFIILFPISGQTFGLIQAWIAQLVAHPLGSRDVQGSNPGKGENLSMKNK